MHNIGRWPNLLVIGAAKCGTTSLHRYLGCHPQIFMSEIKELRFFSADHNWHLGADWYRRQFRSERLYCGESSPIYSFGRNEDIADRIVQYLPDVKLIFIARDPVDRFVSQFHDALHHQQFHGSLDEAVRLSLAGTCHIPNVEGGLYWQRIKPFLERFPREQIHFMDTKTLLSARLESLQDVFRFLGVDDTFDCAEFYLRHNLQEFKSQKNALGRALKRMGNSTLAHKLVPSADVRLAAGERLLAHFSTPTKRQNLAPELRTILIEYYRKDLRCFAEQTGLDISSWPSVNGLWPQDA